MSRQLRTLAVTILASTAMASSSAQAQTAEIEVSCPGQAFHEVVPVTATVRWSGAAALAGLRGSIRFLPTNGNGAAFTSDFTPGPTVNLGVFDGPSRVGIDVSVVPPGLTGGVMAAPWANASGVTIASYDIHVNENGQYYLAQWVPDPSAPNVRLYPTLNSFSFVEAPTNILSSLVWVGGCCTAGPCRADLTGSAMSHAPTYGLPNGTLTNDDFFYYLQRFSEGNLLVCDMTESAVPGSHFYGNPDGVLNNDDFFFYLTIFADGC